MTEISDKIINIECSQRTLILRRIVGELCNYTNWSGMASQRGSPQMKLNEVIQMYI